MGATMMSLLGELPGSTRPLESRAALTQPHTLLRDSSLLTTGAQTGMPATTPIFVLSLPTWATKQPSVTTLWTPRLDTSLVTLAGATWSALARTPLSIPTTGPAPALTCQPHAVKTRRTAPIPTPRPSMVPWLEVPTSRTTTMTTGTTTSPTRWPLTTTPASRAPS